MLIQSDFVVFSNHFSLLKGVMEEVLDRMMSCLNVALQSAAMQKAFTTASASSAFTCRTGAPMHLAKSVGWGDERAWLGLVVNPIWLLTTMCRVPPVVNPIYKAGSHDFVS